MNRFALLLLFSLGLVVPTQAWSIELAPPVPTISRAHHEVFLDPATKVERRAVNDGQWLGYEKKNDKGDWHRHDTFYKVRKGSVQEVANYYVGYKHGPYRKFRKDGTLKQSGAYKNGMKTGSWKQYHQDGKTVQDEAVFNLGKRNGPYVKYDKSGRKIASGTYQTGKKEGLWYEPVKKDKTRIKKTQYENDKPVSTETIPASMAF